MISSVFGASQVNYASATRTSGAASATSSRSGGRTSATEAERAVALRELHARVVRLSRSLETSRTDLTRMRGLSRAGRGGRAVAASDSLGLDLTQTASTLTSTEEINTVATSFSPRGPDWDGPQSTSQITVDGEWTGGWDDTIEFRVHRNRTVGNRQVIRLKMYDGDGDQFDNLRFPRYYDGVSPIDAGYGLTVTLGAGYVKAGESFFVDVSASQGTSLAVDNPLDGSRNTHPELDDGFAVSDGSFDVNGATISVSASDSTQDVLDRINAAGAGVTAAYDAGTDSVTFTHDDAGAEEITLDNDSSGFLAAMKLDGAAVSYGGAGDLDETIEDVGALSGISTGGFSVNDRSFSVDVASDSLGDVLDRINAAGLGVTAAVDEATGEVQFTGSGEMTLDDGTSGFFTGVDVAAGVYEDGGREGLSRRQRRETADTLEELSLAFNELFAEMEYGDRITTQRRSVQSAIIEALSPVFAEVEGDALSSGFGLDLDFGEDEVFDISGNDLDRALGREAGAAFEFLLGRMHERGRGGMVGALREVLSVLETDLERINGHQGILLNAVA